MPLETSWAKNSNVNSENIFDEFTDSQEIKKELEKTDKDNEKDIYYYFKKIGWLLLAVNIISFLFIIACFGYVFIQNNDVKKEYSFLTPICSLFLWSDSIYLWTCYWVTPALEENSNKLNNLLMLQSQKILPLLWDKYSLENYNLSKKVSFLLEKWETRLKPLEILSQFDAMKDLFSSVDKSEITCYNITIENNIISMTCDSFSSDWNEDILNVDDTFLKTMPGWWTSISKASSFINFFEQYWDSPFTIINKPEYYTSETTTWPYTRKTTFQFSLRYTEISELEIN